MPEDLKINIATQPAPTPPPTPTEKPVVQEGIVGFFDILGYQNFLKNNSPEEAATSAIEVLNGLPENSELLKYFGYPDEIIAWHTGNVKWLVFSDTIVMSMPLDKSDTPTYRYAQWFMFLTHTAMLFRHMFTNGLPVRGAIDYGTFLINKSCFAGRPIIDAHDVAQRLDFAGCVVTPQALGHAKRDLEAAVAKSRSKHLRFLERLVVPYLAPLRSAPAEKLHILNFLVRKKDDPWFGFEKGDVREFVLNSFWKHNKDIAPEVIRKVENTEMIFRYLKMIESTHMPKKQASDVKPEATAES